MVRSSALALIAATVWTGATSLAAHAQQDARAAIRYNHYCRYLISSLQGGHCPAPWGVNTGGGCRCMAEDRW
jgi:hypothetical protein